jgi:hypothetical protein
MQHISLCRFVMVMLVHASAVASTLSLTVLYSMYTHTVRDICTSTACCAYICLAMCAAVHCCRICSSQWPGVCCCLPGQI